MTAPGLLSNLSRETVLRAAPRCETADAAVTDKPMAGDVRPEPPPTSNSYIFDWVLFLASYSRSSSSRQRWLRSFLLLSAYG